MSRPLRLSYQPSVSVPCWSQARWATTCNSRREPLGRFCDIDRPFRDIWERKT